MDRLRMSLFLDLKVDYPEKPNIYIEWSSQISIELMFEELLIKCNNIEKG